MDRYEHKEDLIKLEEEILEQTKIVESEQKILDDLKDIYKEESHSYMPILLYVGEKKDGDSKYEYLYYYPDLDRIESIKSNNLDDYLPNTLNLLKYFNINEPVVIINKELISVYFSEVNKLIKIISRIIDSTIILNDIKSWDELRKIMNLNLNGMDCEPYKLKLVKK